jgi:hypothetical protein
MNNIVLSSTGKLELDSCDENGTLKAEYPQIAIDYSPTTIAKFAILTARGWTVTYLPSEPY